MNAIVLKREALRQPPLPQSGPRAKTIAHPWPNVLNKLYTLNLSFSGNSLQLMNGIFLTEKRKEK
jgi:hypothetical protein